MIYFYFTNSINKQTYYAQYRAWSSIVHMLIPNVEALENTLRYFAEIIEAEEVLLFERATFLVISHYQRVEHRDSHRFEKVSNIIKQFKLSCSKLGAKFQSIEVLLFCFLLYYTLVLFFTTFELFFLIIYY